jgi:molecular chaperone HtpG
LLGDPVDSFWVMSAPDFDGKPFKSVTQGAADLALIPRVDATDDSQAEPSAAIQQFLEFIKTTLGDAVLDVRSSERLTDSAVCLVASDTGPDRQLEKILASAGRLSTASKPILEVNPRHQLVISLASLGEEDGAFKEDAVHMLLEEARVLEGERPTDALEFSKRLDRIIGRGLRNSAPSGS